MNITNGNGDTIIQDFVSGKFDRNRVKEIIQNDRTPLPAGFPKLYFNIYGGFVYVTNLLGVTLTKYQI